MENLKKTVTINDVPEEMKLEILSFLDPDSRMEVTKVNSDYNKLICHLNRDKHILSLDKRIIYNYEHYTAMILSKRKFDEAKINLCPETVLDMSSCEPLRMKKIMQKFGPSLKKLEITNISIYSLAEYHHFISNSPGLVELSLSFHLSVSYPKFKFKMKHLKTFLNLKKLSFHKVHGIVAILQKVQCDTLEELSIEAPYEIEITSESFLAVFKLQNGIKKIKLDRQDISLDHLVLEELEFEFKEVFFMVNNIKLIATLMNQPLLKRFSSTGLINDAVFIHICKLKHLEVLHISIDEVGQEAFGKLKNLSNLKELLLSMNGTDHLWDELIEELDLIVRRKPELNQIDLPNLVKLTLDMSARELNPEHFAYLGQNLVNLKHFAIRSHTYDVISFAITSFPNLKTLHVNLRSMHELKGVLQAVGSNSLEELVIEGVSQTFSHEASKVATNLLFAVINLCPNLKRISLEEVKIEHHLIELIQSHPKLTHLSAHFTCSVVEDIFATLVSADCHESDYGKLSILEKMVELFKTSPKFVQLSLKRLDYRYVHPVLNMITADHRKIKSSFCNRDLKLVKKGNKDVYKNFGEQVLKLRY